MKKDKRIWIVGGVEYPTLKAAAEFHNLPLTRVVSRLRKKISLDEAFEIIPNLNFLKKKKDAITVNGYTFETFSDAFRHFNLDKKVAENRKRLGWSFEQIFEFAPPPTPKNWSSVVCKGHKYPSIPAFARAFGLSTSLVRGRIGDMGWTPEQAVGIDEPPNSKFTNSSGEERTGTIYRVTNSINGKSYIGLTDGPVETRWKQHKTGLRTSSKNGGLQQAFIEFGTNAFRFEILEKAAVRTLGEREKFYIEKYNTLSPSGYNLNEGGARGGDWGSPILFKGQWFRSLKDVCEQFNADYDNAQQRIKTYGWTLEEAIGLSNNPSAQGLENMRVTIDGVEFKNKKTAAIHYGISETVVYARLDRGWTIDDAFKKPVRKIKARKK